MRRLVRPLLFFVALCGFTTASQSQPAPGGGYNIMTWQRGYPAATVGGVNAAVVLKASSGWTCTEVVFRVIDDGTNQTLDTATIASPGGSASKSFTGLPNNLKVRVTADSTFENKGAYEFKTLEAWVTTK